jgi:hypothetical protein
MSVSLQKTLFLLVIIQIQSGQLWTQSLLTNTGDANSLSRYITSKYDLDQELINGIQFYERYSRFKGDPFYPENTFFNGSVTLKGTQFTDQELKYDCYTQQLILQYTDLNGSQNQMIMHSLNIDSFRLGEIRFKKLSVDDKKANFYQVISTESITCYVRWYKELSLLHGYDYRFSHEFTKPFRTYIIRYRNQFHPFTSRNSFLSLFPGSMQRVIKKYLREKQFSFKDAEPGEILTLIEFIANLEKKE